MMMVMVMVMIDASIPKLTILGLSCGKCDAMGRDVDN